ncbi:hypothetical protein [Roseibium sp.]|uniref:hypothetical protein n=1 Tax=Roseibium sp. TaxID=1936156 RepID=UPI003BAD9D8F
MELFGQYGAQFVSFGLAIVLAIAQYFLQPKVKLVWGLTHGFMHKVTLEQTSEEEADHIAICTNYHLLSNNGRGVATDVEVTFNYIPKNFEVWPQRQFETSVNPNGRFIVKFGSIAPREQISLNVLMLHGETPSILSVRSNEATGKLIPLIVNRRFPRWLYVVVGALLVLGFASFIYLVIELVGVFAALSSTPAAP